MKLHFKSPDKEQMKLVERLVHEFELDDQQFNKRDFIIALNEDEALLGFVSIKHHASCDELSSLGILNTHRNKGIGKALVNEVIRVCNNALYLTCIIPDFFSKLGFLEITKDIPKEMLDKANYCTSQLPVKGSEYVIMKYMNYEKG